jgi:hypothetical protein
VHVVARSGTHTRAAVPVLVSHTVDAANAVVAWTRLPQHAAHSPVVIIANIGEAAGSTSTVLGGMASILRKRR